MRESRVRARRRLATAARACTTAAWLAVALAALTPASQAVLLASGDGTGHTTPPADDPGFALVGAQNGRTTVWLGQGWVLTAYHVGEGDVTFAGVTYPRVPGSFLRLGVPGNRPDLAMMKIVGDPGLPSPVIASTSPPVGAEVVMIARGKDRGAPIEWSGYDGWNWAATVALRWGTNRVTQTGVVWTNTQSFELKFDPLGHGNSTTYEAQATVGGSGGAVFWKTGGQWQLAGTLFVILLHDGQPASTSLFGNDSVAVDLSAYRSQILAQLAAPACSDSIDNDGDQLIDHPADPHCSSPADTSEEAQVPASAAWSSSALAVGLLVLGALCARRARSSHPTRLLTLGEQRPGACQSSSLTR